MELTLEAFVTDIVFDRGLAAFALGDGQVRWEDGGGIIAHDGAILTAAAHPSGEGLITGGDDGRLVWARRDGVEVIADLPGRWIDAVAVSPGSSLIAFAAGREVQVRDAADRAFVRSFAHERSVAGLALDAKGRRLAAATYGGVALWWARIAEQKPAMMRWAGSHVAAAFSPDGKFIVSSMQENALHGWRLADGRDMRMGGYPAKVKSLVFLADGAWLATSGAPGVVLWPFSGASGPMGKQAGEVGFHEGTLVARAAGEGELMAAGLDDGRVWACELNSRELSPLKAEPGAPISALAVGGGKIAWGDEAGGAGVVNFNS
ncbi:MAG TPA: WD40 repeat domain-containing protein [Caulobacteraceae bacterium]|jgi:WD40 repeat protein|nr:WD40 repeat domain-containing protein [Caulobacteraceae bacterium]